MPRFANPRPFEMLGTVEAEAVCDGFGEVVRIMRAAGFACAMDDRAEHLIDAITLFLLQSRGETP